MAALDEFLLDLARSGRPRPAADLLPRDGERRRRELTSRLLRDVRATSPRPATSTCSTGRSTTSSAFLLGQDVDLRRRRQHGEHARDLAAPRRRQGAARGVGGRRRRSAGLSAGGDLLVRGLHDRLVRAGAAAVHDGLASSPGSFCPHYDGESQRRPLFQRLVGDGTLPGRLRRRRRRGARLPTGRSSARSCPRRPEPSAYRVEADDGVAVETRAAASAARAADRRPARRAAQRPSAHVAIGRTASGPSTALAAAPRAARRSRPARRDEAGRQIGERREDEQPLPGEPMRDDEVGRLATDRPSGPPAAARRRSDGGRRRAGRGRARAGPSARAPAGRTPARALERDQQRERAGRRDPARPGRRGRRRRCGTPAGRRRRPARSRRAARRRGAGRRAGRRARGRRRRSSPAASPRFAPSPMYARTRPGQCPASRSLDSARGRPSPSSSSTRAGAVAPGRSSAGSRRPRAVAGRAAPRGVPGRRRDRRPRSSPASPDGTPFGARLREFVGRGADRPALVVLGSGAIPLATAADRRAFVGGRRATTARRARRTTASRPTSSRSPARQSSPALPDLPTDNALAALARRGRRLRGRRSCAGAGGFGSTSTRRSTSSCSAGAARRGAARAGRASTRAGSRRASTAVAAVAARPGRASSSSPAGRRPRRSPGSSDGPRPASRALVEERGLRASDRRPRRPRQRGPPRPSSARSSIATARRRSARLLARARRRGARRQPRAPRPPPRRRRGRWPRAEDRFASDLLLHERIADPWLRDADAVRRRGADPDRPRRPHARRARAQLALALRERRAMDAARSCSASRPRTSTPVDSDPELVAAIRDEIAASRPDDVRPVHGARALRPGARLLPGGGGPARARRRLPDGARGPPDLRPGDRPARRRRLGGARTARRLHDPRARRRHGALAAALLDGPRGRRRPTSPPSSATGPSRSSRDGSTSCATGWRRRRRRPARAGRRRADRRARHRQRGPRRAADAPGRRARRRPARDLRRRRRDGGFVDVEGEPSTPALAAAPRGGGHRARRRPARGDLPRGRRLGRGGGGGPRRGLAPAHRLRPPGRRALRPGAAGRRERSPPTTATGSTTTPTARSAART